MWVVSATSGLLAGVHELVATTPGGSSTWSVDPGSVLAGAVRAVAPLVAAWLWERVLQAARAEQAERTLAEVRRDRRLLDVARAALRVRRLDSTGHATSRRGRRARRRLDRAHVAALRVAPPAATLVDVLAAVGQVDHLPAATLVVPLTHRPDNGQDAAGHRLGLAEHAAAAASDRTASVTEHVDHEPARPATLFAAGDVEDPLTEESASTLALAVEVVRADPEVSGARLAAELTRRGRPVSTRSGQRWRTRAPRSAAQLTAAPPPRAPDLPSSDGGPGLVSFRIVHYDNGMTERNETAEVATRTCRFPGCTRPAEEGDGRGRPPAYCDDPAHTRAAAFRARRDAEAGGDVDAAGAAAAAEPVTFARVRAGLLVERVEAAVAALSTMTTEVVAELRTLGDVEAVEVELESVSASAEQRAAEARAVAAEAETRRRRAEAAAVEAEQLRDEAEAAAEEALSAEARAREAALVAESVAASAQEEAERLSAEVAGLLDERDAALTQAREVSEALSAAQADAERLAADLDQVRAALAEQTAAAGTLREQVETESARADQAEASVVDLRRTLDERDQAVAALQAQAADQRTALAQAQVRMEETATQRDQLRAQVDERDERIHGLENDHAGARAEAAALTAQLHAEQAAAAAAAALAERTATERVAEVRALYEERISELRQQGKAK